jgi:hypothetical protein
MRHLPGGKTWQRLPRHPPFFESFSGLDLQTRSHCRGKAVHGDFFFYFDVWEDRAMPIHAR